MKDIVEEADVVALIRLDESQGEFVRLDQETGQLDIPLSVVKSLSEWYRRYEMRRPAQPKTGSGPTRSNVVLPPKRS